MADSTNIEPPQDSPAEYTGPAEGDPRDPRQVGDLLPEMIEEINRRAAEPDLFTARSEFIELSNRKARGEDVSDAELETARQNLLSQEERIRRRQPPE